MTPEANARLEADACPAILAIAQILGKHWAVQDEFIHIQQPGIALESIVESLLGDTFASLLLDSLSYPRTCQAGSIDGDDLQDLSPTASLADSCHLFDVTYPRYEYPKSIIDPRRGTQFMVRPSCSTVSCSPASAAACYQSWSLGYFQHLHSVIGAMVSRRRCMAWIELKRASGFGRW